MKGKLAGGVIAAVLAASLPLAALHAAQAPGGGGAAPAFTPAELADFPELRITRYPAAQQRSGREVYRANCASCHGQDYRGGEGGRDLTSSAVVYNDQNGVGLGAFLRGGHMATGVSVASITNAQMADLASYLHAGIAIIADRGYLGNTILVGNAAAGQTYFNGAGGCKSCHSATGDFAGIGTRLDPLTIQARILFPSRAAPNAAGAAGGRGGAPAAAGGRGGAAPAAAAGAAAGRAGAPGAVGEAIVAADAPAAGRGGAAAGGRGGGAAPAANAPVAIAKNAIRATVTAPGQAPVTGQLVRLSPFDVTIGDLTTGERRTWPIENGQPKVTLTDPLQGHATVRQKITDTQMHNLTAYLASLK